MTIDLSNSSHTLLALLAAFILQVLSFWIGHVVGKGRLDPRSPFPGYFILLFFFVPIAMGVINVLNLLRYP